MAIQDQIDELPKTNFPFTKIAKIEEVNIGSQSQPLIETRYFFDDDSFMPDGTGYNIVCWSASKPSAADDPSDTEVVLINGRGTDFNTNERYFTFGRAREQTTQRDIQVGDYVGWTILLRWLTRTLQTIPSLPATDDTTTGLSLVSVERVVGSDTFYEYGLRPLGIKPTTATTQRVNFSNSNQWYLSGHDSPFRGSAGGLIEVFLKTADDQIQSYVFDIDLARDNLQDYGYSGDTPTASDAIPRKFVVFDNHSVDIVVPGSTSITTAGGDTLTVPFQTETQNRRTKETTIFFGDDDCDEELIIGFEDVSVLGSNKNVDITIRRLLIGP